MPNDIQKFELPRLDWHDREGTDEKTGEIIGRIYKDALIENFNAIESKCLELQKLNVLDISIPEPSDFSYKDSNLDDSDVNQVVNLRSLIKILDLQYYPIELSFSGTTCTRCKFYKLVTNPSSPESEEVEIITLANIATNANNSAKYIYLDIENKNIIASTSSSLASAQYKFIGLYAEGKVIHQRSPLYPASTTIKGG